MPRHTISSHKVEIAAPIELVWEILLDLDSYGEWNPFTYRVDTTLKIGDPVDLYVRMPKRGDRMQTEQVRIVEEPNTLSWGTKLGFEFLLKAQRYQCLKSIDDNRCEYSTWDDFDGALTWLVVGLFGEDMLNGFNNMSYALKERAELKYNNK